MFPTDKKKLTVGHTQNKKGVGAPVNRMAVEKIYHRFYLVFLGLEYLANCFA